MAKKIKENDIENYLIKLCKKHDFFTTKFVSPGLNGVPDRLVVTPKQTLFIELKRPEHTTRKLQDAVIRKMVKSGAIVYKADTFYKLDEIFEFLSLNRLPDYKRRRKKRMPDNINKEEIIKEFLELVKSFGIKNPSIRIFYDNKMIETNSRILPIYPPLKLPCLVDIDLFDFVEYGNSETITFDFEEEKKKDGKSLYTLMNGNIVFQEKLESFFEKYNLEIVKGYSWTFSLYPISK